MTVWPNGMVHLQFVTVCAYGLLGLSSITALSEHRVPPNTVLASNQCTIPFGRKWHSGKRKCRQQTAKQVLACNGRNAKRNLIPARARSVLGANCVPAIDRAPSPPSPCEPEIPFGLPVLAFPVCAVFSVCAVSFRHRILAKRNGARLRTNQGKRRAAGRIVPWPGTFRPPPVFSLFFPDALHHSARRASVERNLLPARAQGYSKRNPPENVADSIAVRVGYCPVTHSQGD